MTDFKSRMYAALRRELQPVPGIVSALDRISTPICVASSGDREKIRTSLEVTGLLPRFEGRLFSEDQIEEVRRSNDIVDVIKEYVPLKRAGKDFKALCPFHSEKTARENRKSRNL